MEGFKAAGGAVKSVLAEDEKKKQDVPTEPEATEVVMAEAVEKVQQIEVVQNETEQEEILMEDVMVTEEV